MGVLWLFSVLLVAALGAHAQRESQALPALEPPGQKSCLEIRDSLERMLYRTFKGSLPRRLLKDALPGLVDPLLPAMCLQAGSDATKWLRHHLDKLPVSVSASASSSSSIHRLSRPKRQLSMFNPFMMGMGTGMGGPKVKDPGDHPPPGMPRHLFKDPGDHLPALFGFRKVKDPQDRTPPPPGEGASGAGGGMNPMMAMMQMMQMMNFNRQMSQMMNARNANGGSASGSSSSGSSATSGGKPRSGRFFGDVVPGR